MSYAGVRYSALLNPLSTRVVIVPNVADADQKEAGQPDKGTHPKPFPFPPNPLLSLFPFPCKDSVGRVAAVAGGRRLKKKKEDLSWFDAGKIGFFVRSFVLLPADEDGCGMAEKMIVRIL
ncbi:hypothetical protein OPV22_022157 [Ensete ventricosum]|uniref:Uncharacterized protein n=1 Tax=Ensete ventricosum TaxID=4639 RepID=A0AAV8PBU1_ENSVE|nr:hypothetical protein OPV22_022157 [Ensete ventricosum]